MHTGLSASLKIVFIKIIKPRMVVLSHPIDNPRNVTRNLDSNLVINIRATFIEPNLHWKWKALNSVVLSTWLYLVVYGFSTFIKSLPTPRIIHKSTCFNQIKVQPIYCCCSRFCGHDKLMYII